jgi:hypothetical protein
MEKAALFEAAFSMDGRFEAFVIQDIQKFDVESDHAPSENTAE